MRNSPLTAVTIKTLRSDKRRNFFIIAAIALTTFMITSVLTVGMSYHRTLTVEPFRSEGILTHASFQQGAVSPAQSQALRTRPYVRQVSNVYRLGTGFLPGFDRGILLATMNQETWQHFLLPVFADVSGHAPVAADEIALSRAHLTEMGITEPYLGMDIPMEYLLDHFAAEPDPNRLPEAGTFKLSAIYTEFVSLRPGFVFTPVYVSEVFAISHGGLPADTLSVNVLFNSASRAEQYAQRVAQDLGISPDNLIINPALENAGEADTSAMVLTLSLIIAFLMLIGFLLIYNVMYISVAKDIRFYGLLKSIGTTGRQIRRIVNGQVLTLYLIGLPIGLALSVATSFILVPAVLSGARAGAVISFSPIIYLTGALFALITAYLGAITSASKAAKVTPIEAIRHIGEINTDGKTHISKVVTPARMALRNTFRERKRAIIVLTSLLLGITVFTSAMGIINSMDIAGYVQMWKTHDIALASTDTSLLPDGSGFTGINPNLINQIRELPGVVSVSELTSGFAGATYPEPVIDWVTQRLGAFNPVAEITGIDFYDLERLISQWEPDAIAAFDRAAFERGEVALVEQRASAWTMGELLPGYFPIDAQVPLKIGETEIIPTIGGYVSIDNMTGFSVRFGANLSLIMSNEYLNSIGQRPGTGYLGVNVDPDSMELVNAALSELITGQQIEMASTLAMLQEQQAARTTMQILGSTIGGILALIGLFNFINLIAVGLLTRKRELATLESIGMSRNQMRKMLRWEGAIYWIITLAFSATAGTAISYGLFRLMRNLNTSLLPQFNYPYLPVGIVLGLIMIICTVTPEVCYRSISKATLIERLRENE